MGGAAWICSDHSEIPVVIGINSRIADGHDPSWLWDVPFEKLAGRKVVATGERCRDLAVRLKYAGLEHLVVARADAGAAGAGGAPAVEYVGNYTAFQQLRRSLVRRRSLLQTLEPRTHLFRARRTTASRRGECPLWPRRTRWSPSTVPRPQANKGGASESALRIAVVHPDLLGTYGDGGNGMVLACRAAWRGWPVELMLARSDKPLPTADIYCLGGGEDGPQVEAAESAVRERLAARWRTVLRCWRSARGSRSWARSFPDAEGRSCDGLGLIDVVTAKGHGQEDAWGRWSPTPEQPTLGLVSQKAIHRVREPLGR